MPKINKVFLSPILQNVKGTLDTFFLKWSSRRAEKDATKQKVLSFQEVGQKRKMVIKIYCVLLCSTMFYYVLLWRTILCSTMFYYVLLCVTMANYGVKKIILSQLMVIVYYFYAPLSNLIFIRLKWNHDKFLIKFEELVRMRTLFICIYLVQLIVPIVCLIRTFNFW